MNGFANARMQARNSGFALVTLMLALAAALMVGLFASAQPAYAAEDDATLTLVVTHEEKGVQNAIPGAEFTAYKVAELDAGNNYQLVSPFDSESVDFNKQLTAKEAAAAAKSMAKIVDDKGVKGQAAITGAEGTAYYGVLDKGVYLLVQTGSKDAAMKYYVMDPFLVNVPQMQNGEVVYDVVAAPKPELKPEPKPQPKPEPDKSKSTSTTPKSSPKTGDTLDWGLVTVAAIAGLSAMLVAIFAARSRRDR